MQIVEVVNACSDLDHKSNSPKPHWDPKRFPCFQERSCISWLSASLQLQHHPSCAGSPQWPAVLAGLCFPWSHPCERCSESSWTDGLSIPGSHSHLGPLQNTQKWGFPFQLGGDGQILELVMEFHFCLLWVIVLLSGNCHQLQGAVTLQQPSGTAKHKRARAQWKPELLKRRERFKGCFTGHAAGKARSHWVGSGMGCEGPEVPAQRGLVFLRI